METSLQKKFDRLQHDKVRLLAGLKACTAPQLEQSPGPNQWSIVEVIQHINRSEYLSFRYIERQLDDPSKAKKTGLPNAFRSRALNTVLWSPFKWKAPGLVSKFEEEYTYDEMVALWNLTRTNLEKTLNAIPNELLKHTLFKHPYAGHLNVYQMLNFMHYHLQHHVKQINRIKKTVM